MKAALITGVTGQDGSYLAEFLLNKNYSVYGLVRYCSEKKHERIEHLKLNPEFHILEGDLTDTARINSIINSFEQYDLIEVYNLGAQSHVKVSFSQPEYTANVDALGTLRILEAIRQTNFESKFKFYQAGTSEMFGKVQAPIQMRPHLFTQEAHMVFPRCLGTGLPRITVSHMGCMPVQVFCSTTNLSVVAQSL